MFADLSGSTSLGERLDPEELRGILGGFFAALARAIQRYEGTIDKYIGDAVMAVFGAPIIHEDDAARAIHAALDMQRAMATLNDGLERRHGVRLALRIGINTGEVVAGLLAGEVQSTYTIVGDTVNTAQRLEANAQPGEILVGAKTYRLATGVFEFAAPRLITVKGREEPVPVYRVIRARDEAAQSSDGSGMVGRAEELQRLYEALQVASAGGGHAVGVTGEAGLGKTRLVSAFLSSLSPGIERSVARCASFDQQTPYALLAELLRSLVGLQRLDSVGRATQVLTAALQRLRVDLDETTLALLLDVLGYEAASFEPEARRRVLVAAMLKILAGRCAIAPLVLTLEDLHWVDPASASALRDLVPGLTGLRCLVVAIGRREWQASWLQTHIALRPMSGDDAAQIVANALGGPADPTVLDVVLGKAGGNPYFMGEIARSLQEGGLVVQREGRWMAAGRIDLRAGVPDTVQEVLGGRLDRLATGPRLTVQAAAVVGRTFLQRVVERVADSPTPARDLDSLVERAFVELRAAIPERMYAFSHTLIQEVAYNRQLLARRRALHGAIGDVLNELAADRPDEFVDLLAYHYGRSEESAKARFWLLRAADRARRLYANEEALDYYHAAVERSVDDDVSAAAAHEGLGDVRRHVGQYQEALTEYAWALRLHPVTDAVSGGRVLRKRGSVQQVTGHSAEALASFAAALDRLPASADHERAVVLLELGQVAWQQGQYDEAIERLEAAVDLAHRAEAADALADAYKHLGTVNVLRGDPGQGLAFYERSQSLYEQAGDSFGQANVLSNIGIVHRRQGRYAEALSAHGSALEVRERIGDPHGIGTTRNNLAQIHLARGAIKQAREDFAAALELWRAIGYAQGAAIARTGLGIALVQDGDPAAGRDQLLTALQEWDALGSRTYLAETYSYLAQATMTDDPDAALDWARRAVEIAHELNTTSQEGVGLQVLGRVLMARGEIPEAVEALERSRELLAAGAERQELARTLLALGRAYLRLPEDDARRPAAEALQAEARTIFGELGAELDLARAS
jgi:adenylate cyclase